MTAAGRQGGAALLWALSLGILAGAVLVLERPVSTAVRASAREAATARQLADAERALIAWSVTAPLATGRSAPGHLPFPDRNRDGNYDGRGDCVTFGLNDSHLLGRLPWAGASSPCPRAGLHIESRDGWGERLWYAVSRNLVVGGAGGPINPDMGEPGRMIHPWIALRDSNGRLLRRSGGGGPLPVAAVILAPGPALTHQDRRGDAPSPPQYLDRRTVAGTTYDNADADGCADAATPPCAGAAAGEEFVLHGAPGSPYGFNDRLAYITADEILRAVERRVLGEIAIALIRYRDAYGVYPWLAEFRGVTGQTFKSNLSRAGPLAVHLEDEVFATSFRASWRLVDVTPTTVTRHSGDARLVPPLADAMSGAARVSSHGGRCRWSDWTRGDCVGTQAIASHHRPDLGIAVRRTVEIESAIVDPSPTVIPPAARDPRRRTLVVSRARLASPPAATWNVRITDDDGVNRGSREVSVDSDTGGAIVVSDIRYDLSVVFDDVVDDRDELPEWFVENDWHHFIHAAFSADAVAGGNGDGDDDCTTPVDDCLTLMVAGRPVPTGVRALVISSGAVLAHQDRAVGDCDGDGIRDEYLCAWLEGDNGDRSTAAEADTYVRGEFSRHFNDQVRIVDPPR